MIKCSYCLLVRKHLFTLDALGDCQFYNMIDIFQQFQVFQRENVIVSFRGEVSFELVKAILDNVESRLMKIEPELKVRKKVVNVLIEAYQNLCHHIETGEDLKAVDQGKMGLMLLNYDAKNYYVATGNFIMNHAIPKLESWLNEINSKDEKELRMLYKEVLNNETFSKKGGGGLGFIDISRKSGSKMEFKFHKQNKDYSFFEFRIKVSRKI